MQVDIQLYNKATSLETSPRGFRPGHRSVCTVIAAIKRLEIATNYAMGHRAYCTVIQKRDADDTNNYRGITLSSCFAKLFTSCENMGIRK